MTLEEFVATKKIETIKEFEKRVKYPVCDDYTNIISYGPTNELYIGQRDGKYELDIMRTGWISKRLDKLEHIIYEWAKLEGYFE